MGITGKLSGKASGFTLDGVDIKITKYTPKHTRDLVDTVDTGSYDETTDMLHQEQIPVKLGTELDIEFIFYKTSTMASIIAKLYSGTGPLAVVLNLDAGTIYGHGNFDLKDCECDVPSADKVTGKATLVSNGVFTTGS